MTHIPQDALVMVGDGARAIFFRNSGTALQPKLSVEKVFEQENPPTHEQGTERPRRGSDFTGGWATNVQGESLRKLLWAARRELVV